MKKKFKRLFGLTLLFSCLLINTACAPVIATGAIAGLAVYHDRRSTGTIIDDHSVEFSVRKALRERSEIKNSAHINVVSYNAAVLLVGQVANQELKTEAQSIAFAHAPHSKIYNELTVAAPTSMMVRSNDGLITTRIKSAMLIDKRIDATRIKVVTEDGIVYLLGLVTPSEEKVAVEIARTTGGVKKVIKIFNELSLK